MRPPLAVLFALVCSPALAAEDPALVAPTGPRSPAEERKAFKVPDGFDVQLVASEPDIQKPMQMAFDAKGRLWVTTSYHYPFAAPAGKGTDKLFVLSDFGPDGKARKVETFAAGLNIPIGILPLPDCKGCVVSSVGEILKLTDTDGDGKADKREVLFAGFGTRDTHGMTNSFTLMPDGWVYACHGFANDSRVKGTDGHEVVMNSGHTFRFRPDGSRIEVVTRGQVNPFGIAVDPWFNLYTADCHSKPITQVIPGAYYDSFGKPHDGLGYGPHVTRHDHNSTGLCGVAWYDADHFPAEYKGCMFVGNVVTNRINFDRIEWKGSTPVAKELPDFLVSEDRWFRPTDIKLGPDGALYVTDFYNKIIGHYEVDLKHPGRDKDHGRLWRIVWTGKDAKPPTPARADFTAATDVELFALLGHPNLTVRMTAGNQLVARSKPGSMPDIRGDGVKDVGENPATMSAAAGWVASAAEAGGVGVADLYPYLVEAAKTVRPPLTPDQYSTLVMRAMGSHPRWVEQHRKTALRVLAEFDAPRLRRATVQAVAAHPHADFVKPLVELIPTIPADDTHLGLAARIALRNCLRDTPDGWDAAPGAETPAGAVVADVALAIPSERAASYLAEYIGHHKTAAPRLAEAAGHVGRYGKHPVRWPVIDRLRSESAAPVEPAQAARALEALRALVRGVQAGGAKLTPGEARSFESMAGREVADLSPSPAALAAVVDLYAALPAACGDDARSIGTAAALTVTEKVAAADCGDDTRAAAAAGLARLDPPRGTKVLAGLLNAPTVSPALKEKVLFALAGVPLREARAEVNAAAKGVPYRVAVAAAQAMAGTADGGEHLLASVKAGHLPARTLQDRQVLERLKAAGVTGWEKSVAELTKGLPPADAKLADLIRQRAGRVAAVKADAAEGAKVFAKNCAACHRIGDQGGKVAPQLDGVGNRGAERLLEDILDPNRNVDAAFRARVVTLTDGTTKTGLMLRVEGVAVVFADAEGKEFRVPAGDIEQNRETALSPMPANFGETIPEPEFYHLLAYLLEQRAKEPAKQ